MIDPNERQQLLDEEHLRLLRIAYLLLGGTYTVCAMFPILHVGIGIALLLAPVRGAHTGIDPRYFGLFFVVIGLCIMIGFATFGGLQLYAARCVRLRRSRTLCLIVAAMTCLMIPIGTALGVFTFIVLGRPTVQSMFAAGDRTTSVPQGPSLESPRPPAQA